MRTRKGVPIISAGPISKNVSDLIEIDKKGIPLDIKIDKGAYIGVGVKLNYNIEIG